MDINIQVAVGTNGVPYAEVPPSYLWDLVEYLSYQRVAVSYRYEHEHFKVLFPKSDAATAERLLADWSHSKQPMQHS